MGGLFLTLCDLSYLGNILQPCITLKTNSLSVPCGILDWILGQRKDKSGNTLSSGQGLQ